MKNVLNARTALAVVASTAATVFVGGIASAEPVGGADSPAIAATIDHLRAVADVERHKVLEIVTPPQSFFFPATTIGCSSIGNPALFTAGTAQAGPSVLPPVANGQLGFQAGIGRSGEPVSSNLQVVWLNPGTGKSGVTKLEGPAFYGLAETGPGIVVASLSGTVEYPPAPVEQLSGSSCTVTPTVGAFIS